MRFETGGEGQELQQTVLHPGDSFHITPLLRHRMIAQTDCDILEASTPELDDVVRLEDRYGRVK
jgi:quercetin dioxygenase-like cupin family protein